MSMTDTQIRQETRRATRVELYDQAITWIALNDEPTIMRLELLVDFIPVLLVADVFGVPSQKVAQDIIDYRQTQM